VPIFNTILMRDPSAKFTNKVAMHESILLASTSGFCLVFGIVTVKITYCSFVTSIIIYKNRQYLWQDVAAIIFVSSEINYVALVAEMDSEIYPSTMMLVPVV